MVNSPLMYHRLRPYWNNKTTFSKDGWLKFNGYPIHAIKLIKWPTGCQNEVGQVYELDAGGKHLAVRMLCRNWQLEQQPPPRPGQGLGLMPCGPVHLLTQSCSAGGPPPATRTEKSDGQSVMRIQSITRESVSLKITKTSFPIWISKTRWSKINMLKYRFLLNNFWNEI